MTARMAETGGAPRDEVWRAGRGQGDSPAHYTRIEKRNLEKAAKVHYFTTQPANKFIEMKLDIKKRVQHAERVFHPKKKIDNDAPRLYPRIPRTERAAYRLDDVMLENKQLLERICTIWRTKGKVDTSPPNVQWKSNFRQRMWDMVKIEADNLAMLYFIQNASAQVPTRTECARDFKAAVEKMKFISHFPLAFIKDTNRDAPLPMLDPPKVDPNAPPRKRVFMEFITGQERILGRIEMELFEEEAPQTVANFLAHIRGEVPRPAQEDGEEKRPRAKKQADEPRTYSYRDAPLHRILPGYYCLGGDVVNMNGSAGSSIHGDGPFPDEKNDLTHSEPGLLCTIGATPDSNDSKFMITMKPLPTLDDRSTVFGRVTKGFEVLAAISAMGARASGKPLVPVYCCDCGEIARSRGKRLRGGGSSSNNRKTQPLQRQRKSVSGSGSARMSASSVSGKAFRSPYATPRRSSLASPRSPRF